MLKHRKIRILNVIKVGATAIKHEDNNSIRINFFEMESPFFQSMISLEGIPNGILTHTFQICSHLVWLARRSVQIPLTFSRA